ncbi:MAG TPA: D-alanyl-D-alanine carboxypeptidase family protein, partial [Alphaproteobacteria bacterium]|nr:D-alanyl-D-alanine carboxypeptidase family protein [Alphaproteobacteria bacterium]
GTMGTEESFVMLMNEKAAELGLKDTFFVNSHGLSDEAQLTTCQDLAKLSINLIKQFPELYPIHGEKQFTYNKVSQGNRNPLLYKEMGCDGVKTGHTEAGGYGVVASTTQDGRRLLLVINGCKSMQQRATEAQKLLSWARQAFQNVKVYEKGQLIKTVPVVKGAQDEVAVTVEKDVLVTMAKQASKNYEAMLKLTSPLVAPLKKGQEVGTLELTLPDQSISKIPVVTAVSVEGASFLKRLMGSISYLLWGTSSATKELATS